MVQRDEVAVEAFVETFGATLVATGLPRLVARVTALMLADEDGRMTASEIRQALHISAAGVSGAIGFLHEYGFVRKERERGSRRDVYVLQPDTWHDVNLRKMLMIGYLVDQLQRGVQAVGGEQTAAGRRLAYSAQFYRFVADEMEHLIARWEARKPELKARYLDG